MKRHWNLTIFGSIRKSKQPIDLMSVNVDEIVVSEKFKHSDQGFKYFIGYQEAEIVIIILCIISPQISGYIKYFENGGKNMFFLFKMMKWGKNMKKFGMWLKTN